MTQGDSNHGRRNKRQLPLWAIFVWGVLMVLLTVAVYQGFTGA